MAHTITIYSDGIEGVDAAVYADIAFSGTYATGGETLTSAETGLSRIKSVDGAVTSLTTGASGPVLFNRATGKILLTVPAGTEVANGASLTGITATVRLLGA